MRPLYFIFGLVLVSLGILGAFLPVMPTTIFLILALACFSRSSPKAEAWLLQHPRFGEPLRAWREEGSISAKNKAFALVLIWFSIGASALFLVSVLWVRGMLLFTAVVLTFYLLSRPTRRVTDLAA